MNFLSDGMTEDQSYLWGIEKGQPFGHDKIIDPTDYKRQQRVYYFYQGMTDSQSYTKLKEECR